MSASGSINRSRVDEPNSKKPACEKVEDRISSLPEELRIDIISRLPFRQALKTCILSKSWKRVFSSLPNLAFWEYDFLYVPNLTHRFAALIDWTLDNHDYSDIHSLVIQTNIVEPSCLTLKDTWVNFAVEHNVQNLNLTVKIDETGLPSSLCTSRSLKVFKLMARMQLLRLPSVVYLPNLTEMTLTGVIFPDDISTEKLFAGCPLLASLYVRNCEIFQLTQLKIPCPRLKTLLISHCAGIDACILNLQGTCLEKLHYVGMLARNFEFGNMGCLVNVIFDISTDLNDGRNHSELAPIAWTVLRELTHVSELTLSVLFYKVLTEVHHSLWQLGCFKNLASVQLFLWPSADVEIVMTLLSKFCRVQNLEIFILRSLDTDSTFSMEWNRMNYRLEGIFKHLEHLEINNFEGFDLEMGFLMFILQNAKSLTRVTIGTPKATITHYGAGHVVSRINRTLKQEITEKLWLLRYLYPTVAITIVEIP